MPGGVVGVPAVGEMREGGGRRLRGLGDKVSHLGIYLAQSW